MKNLIKILMLSLLLFTLNSIKAQDCLVSNGQIHMSMVSQSTIATNVYTTIRVTTSSPVYQIRVGSRTCRSSSGVTTCSGTFVSPLQCSNYSRWMNCYVTKTSGCSSKKDGCVVVIEGRGC